MSVVTESSSVSSKRSTSPRPPAVGEEVKKFHDTAQRVPESYKNWNMECFSKTSCGDSVVRSVTPTCTGNVTECTEASSNPSPPAAHKWAQSLHYLLEDDEGCTLFTQFLKQDGQDTNYLFNWFLCQGVKKNDPSDPEGLVKLIKAVFKKIKRISVVSDETKEEIRQKLATNTEVNDTIFDTAQREIEDYMRKTTYPNFLRSDLYIQHLGGWQSELSPERELLSPAPVDLLPTVHEDAELNLDSNKSRLTKSNLLQRSKVSSVYKLKQEGPAGFLGSPYNNYSSYHSKYGSFLPASAVDSELQSLSSDALTDDTMSLAGSSVVDFPMNSRSKQKHPQKCSKPIVNKDHLIAPPFIVHRTDSMPEDAIKQLRKQDPEEFFSLLSKKLNKLAEEQKTKEKMEEKLKSVENDVPKADGSSRTCRKSNSVNPMFESGLLYAPMEENVQDILDQHISRVFEDSGNHTPVGCLSPPPVARPSRVPPLRGYVSEPADYAKGASHKRSQFSQYTVPNSIRLKKDHDTHSPESAMLDHVSNDNMNSSYRSPYSFGSSEPVDYSKRSNKEHSKRYASKKLSAMTDSYSSFVDSGISLACESLPSYSKVTHWLEAKKLCEQEREQFMWRNSSTSPVLSRSSSSRKSSSYNNTRSSSQDIVCSQRPAATSQQLSQDSIAPIDTTYNLLEARRRLEDENRSKMKLKSAQGSRNSHDMTRLNHDMARMKVSSKGYDSYDDALYHRKPNRKSCASNVLESMPMNTGSNDVTVIGYSYGRQAVPYLSKLPFKNITLKQFKSQISKKGNFKYFFKTASNDFGTGVVFEEVTDDCQVLPLWEGKVFCVIESMDDNMVM